eukprot:CAMPEP_0171136868 /NCGR_PEP_ID=MMETSP0766_2-20121228/132292_1 /TAXON_ID=439317 /ORGANISM="Gambierdiscus australes, Strain CAWD 149" /LENGTH=33 /DNA_ID= /DNA_START= /DNA_END= /DNA_ORIENTATION=
MEKAEVGEAKLGSISADFDEYWDLAFALYGCAG